MRGAAIETLTWGERGKPGEQNRAASPRLCLPPDPGREQRDADLRHDDARRDQHRCPLRGARGHDAAHQRQHGGVGEMEQQHAAREREQPAVARQSEKSRHKRLEAAPLRAAVRSF